MVVLGCGKQVLGVRAARPGSGRFGVGFWVGFWVGLRARDFPTERVLSRTPLIIRTVGTPPASEERSGAHPAAAPKLSLYI